MGIQFNFRQLVALKIQNRDTPATVSHVDVLCRGIQASVIGVIAKVDGAQRLEIGTIKNSHSPVCGIGYEQTLLSREVEDALRPGQPFDSLRHLATFDIDDFHCVVAQRRDEKALALQIEAQVIDSSRDIGKWNGLYQPQ